MTSFYILILFIGLVAGCPEFEIPPCSCKTIGFHSSVVTCSAADDIDLIRKSIGSMGPLPIRKVEIFESSLLYLPEKIFDGLNLETLFIAGTTLRSLSDTDTAFFGLENSLEVLKIHECPIFDGIDWHQLRNLHKLKEISFLKIGLTAIDDEIKNIDGLHLTYLMLNQDRITFISDFAFSTFKHLVTLSLKNNFINVVKRSMLPDPATELSNIILSHNRIDSLPNDFFANMPKLIAVTLGNNQILTMEAEVFKPVWNQLNKIDMTGNALRCDCRMKWIIKQTFPKSTWGECDEPSSLKGKLLTEIQESDLWCYV